MNTKPKEMQLTLQIPLTIRMQQLRPDQEDDFVSKCMAEPGSCDNDWSEDENKAWFSEMWRQQIRFQQALQDNPEHLSSFLRHIILERINTPLFFLNERPFLPSPEIEEVVGPIVADLDAEAHFFPGASLGVDTRTMLSDLLDATDIRLSSDPELVA